LTSGEKRLEPTSATVASGSRRPIGVFDSGVGGLSILQALRAELPAEDVVYIADSGNAPYGERDAAHVLARSRIITKHLREHHDVQLLVVACNTATALAIDTLRRENPGFDIVGVEPALKPAAALTRTGRVGVMATRGTLNSNRFQALMASLGNQAEFLCQPCDGLAEAIEQHVHTDNTTKLIALCAQYTGAIGQFGTAPGQIDTLVLGCTHYPFAQLYLRELTGPDVPFIATGEPVARQTRRLLAASVAAQEMGTGQIIMGTTGQVAHLKAAAAQWLNWRGRIDSLSI